MLEEGKVYRLGTFRGRSLTICIESILEDTSTEQTARGWLGTLTEGYTRERIVFNKETRKVKILNDDD